MRLELQLSSPVPLFQQLVDEVQRCIAVGILKADDPLPAVRTLAAEVGVNPNTVQHAYRVLEQQGIVRVKRGLGTFVNARRPASRQALVVKAREIAERMLREGYRHGVLASDLLAALQDIAPRAESTETSGAGSEQQVRGD